MKKEFTAGDRVRSKLYMRREFPELVGDDEFESYVALWIYQTRIGETGLDFLEFMDEVDMETLGELAEGITASADPTNARSGGA